MVLDEEHVGDGRMAAARLMMAIALAATCLTASAGSAAASADRCPNAAFRTGPSGGLPDCRAYEMVTPVEKGRTQALTFTGGSTRALVAGNGERLALETVVALEPNPEVPASFLGSRVIFSRNSVAGWTPTSLVPSGGSARGIDMRLFSPDLSQVALEWTTRQTGAEGPPPNVFEAGPLGGLDVIVPSVPQGEAELLGAAPNFSDVLVGSTDHNLLSSSTGTDVHAYDLYDWTGKELELVNTIGGVFSNLCGATLGSGPGSLGVNNSAMVNAVSEDGSKIFFTSPRHEAFAGAGEPGCEDPARLYMRVSGGEIVKLSAPEPGVEVGTVERPRLPVRYNYATLDGSKVFFNTETALTADDKSKANKLFEYDTATKGLRRVADGVPPAVGVGLINEEGFIFSEDGSVVYVESEPGGNGLREIYRVDTTTGESSFVADAYEPNNSSEPSYSTPHGEYFLFASTGVTTPDEPRGAGHTELYRYASATGSVVCVTCGTGVAPKEGEVILRSTELEPLDVASPLNQLSEDGQKVFFQTTARLVVTDTNSSETEFTTSSGTPGLDVYEWEADGSGGCELSQGCTYLLSAGEASGPSTFLGASKDGRDVFLAASAQLTPQGTPGFPNIYDARVGGGFYPPQPEPPCLLSCQAVGAPAPLFGPGASLTFSGIGNPPLPKKRKPKHNTRHKRRPATGGHHANARRASKTGRRS